MKTLYIMLAWLGAVLALSLAGKFDAPPGAPPLANLLALLIPILIYAIDRRFLNSRLLSGIHNLDVSTTIYLQTLRVVGVVFLIAYANGHLPSGFALPAGLGDVAVGLAAPWVAGNLMAGKPYAIALARLWNYLGLFDLVDAVSMGVTHTYSPIGIFAQSVSMHPLTQYPLSLIPTWIVPLAILLHLRSLQGLRQMRSGAHPLCADSAIHDGNAAVVS